jgi:N-acetylglucosamine kinase-like BadF-type ATPase
MRRLYLGVDGGQSSTTALIADESGRIIGRGRGGPCNHVSAADGRAKFFSAIGSCLEQARREAQVAPEDLKFASVCLGFSGGGEDKERYVRELIHSEFYKITHDAEIALIGATAGEPGIILIAGTGSIAFGRNGKGETARAGGWGYIFGDEGGAFDLARQALRAALRQEEGWGEATSLREKLLRSTGAASANDLLHRFYGSFDRTQIATLAVLTTEAAEEGDAAANAILERAAQQLGEYVQGVYLRLFQEPQVVSIACVGGVFESVSLRQSFARVVLSSIGSPVIAPLLSPAAGALLEALHLAGKERPLSGLAPEETL